MDVTILPEDHQRQLYDALHLQIRYDAQRHELIFRVTLDADTAPSLANMIKAKKFAMLRVPPAGARTVLDGTIRLACRVGLH